MHFQYKKTGSTSGVRVTEIKGGEKVDLGERDATAVLLRDDTLSVVSHSLIVMSKFFVERYIFARRRIF